MWFDLTCGVCVLCVYIYRKQSSMPGDEEKGTSPVYHITSIIAKPQFKVSETKCRTRNRASISSRYHYSYFWKLRQGEAERNRVPLKVIKSCKENLYLFIYMDLLLQSLFGKPNQYFP